MQSLLHRLGLDRRNVRSLSLLPLVEVAWADGRIQPRELAVIEEKARTNQLREEDWLVLRNWLVHPPSPAYLQYAHALIAELRRTGDPNVDPSALASLLDDALAVARANGGVLGLWSVCRAEKDALERLRVELAETWAPAESAHGAEDFQKNPIVTLSWDQPDLDGEAVLSPQFGPELRLPVPKGVGRIIGSAEDAGVRIVGDVDVSPRHAHVYDGPGGFSVAELQGPVWVNGERIVLRRLLGGETVRLTSATAFVFKLVRPVGVAASSGPARL